MAFVHSKNSVVKLDTSTGLSTDISDYVDNVSVPDNIDQTDITTLGDGARNFTPGLRTSQISLSGPYDTTLAIQMSALVSATTAVTFEFHPNGTGSGNPKISTECRVASWNPSSAVGDVVKWSATLQAVSAITYATN